MEPKMKKLLSAVVTVVALGGIASAADMRMATYEVTFLDVLPACRDLNDALLGKLSFALAKKGQSVWQDYLLRTDLARKNPGAYPSDFGAIQPSLYEDTRCLVVGGSGDRFYSVLENSPKPEGVVYVPNGKVAVCIMHTTKATREQPCSWVIANPDRVVTRPSKN
jgi:hypothetical protein